MRRPCHRDGLAPQLGRTAYRARRRPSDRGPVRLPAASRTARSTVTDRRKELATSGFRAAVQDPAPEGGLHHDARVHRGGRRSHLRADLDHRQPREQRAHERDDEQPRTPTAGPGRTGRRPGCSPEPPVHEPTVDGDHHRHHSNPTATVNATDQPGGGPGRASPRAARRMSTAERRRSAPRASPAPARARTSPAGPRAPTRPPRIIRAPPPRGRRGRGHELDGPTRDEPDERAFHRPAAARQGRPRAAPDRAPPAPSRGRSTADTAAVSTTSVARSSESRLIRPPSPGRCPWLAPPERSPGGQDHGDDVQRRVSTTGSTSRSGQLSTVGIDRTTVPTGRSGITAARRRCPGSDRVADLDVPGSTGQAQRAGLTTVAIRRGGGHQTEPASCAHPDADLSPVPRTPARPRSRRPRRSPGPRAPRRR